MMTSPNDVKTPLNHIKECSNSNCNRYGLDSDEITSHFVNFYQDLVALPQGRIYFFCFINFFKVISIGTSIAMEIFI